MKIEPDRSKAQAVRPSVSAVIWDGGARIRIEDALARRGEAFVR